ncbi:hypothetical protein HHK36_020022 [Tetracentron sinense]|uniref:GOLD domain-containing protein n=1 Tax=Tetracentron sinense TaxID=13715 RepID=A0A834YQY5_TETSI|nr:hypothetical protein HHK36_020022 [Tetracentron sinense]
MVEEEAKGILIGLRSHERNESGQLFSINLGEVTSPSGNTLHHVENVTHSQYAFTTSEAGNYLECFWVDGHHQVGAGTTDNLDWKIGIAPRDWQSVAKKGKD